MMVVAVAIGGAAGAVCRWLLSRLNGARPWGTLAANMAGSLLLGWYLADHPTHLGAATALDVGVATGFCGGLTTFSTFAVEVVGGRRPRWRYLALTVAAGLVLAWVGLRLGGAAWR